MGDLQERITSTNKGSITSVQAVYVPADDFTDPAVATTFAHLGATVTLSRSISEIGIYPAVDPLESFSRVLDPNVVGEEHYRVAQGVKRVLQEYKELQDIIAILGQEELTEDQKLTVGGRAACSNFLSQPFFVAEVFTGRDGKYVPLEETIRGFAEILDGKHDDLPEDAFYMVGTIDEAVQARGHVEGRRKPAMRRLRLERPRLRPVPRPKRPDARRGHAERRITAMANKLQVELVTPEGRVFSEEADFVLAPGVEGDLGVLPRHIALLTPLRNGVVTIRNDGRRACARGFGRIPRGPARQGDDPRGRRRTRRGHRRGACRGGAQEGAGAPHPERRQ